MSVLGLGGPRVGMKCKDEVRSAAQHSWQDSEGGQTERPRPTSGSTRGQTTSRHTAREGGRDEGCLHE